MALPFLLALGTIGFYHKFLRAGPRGTEHVGSRPTLELQLHEFYPTGGNVTGFALTSGTSEFAHGAVFKEHLLKLLRANSPSLEKLSDAHLEVETRNRIELLSPMRQRYSWSPSTSGAHGSFVPESVEIEFSVAFDHSQRISRAAVEESLSRIVGAGPDAWGADVQVNNASMPRGLTTQCNENTYKDKCKKICTDDSYLYNVCRNCDCSGFGGTASCSCFIQVVHFSGGVIYNTIDAVLMILCGLCCCRGATLRRKSFDTSKMPDIGNGDFQDGLCNCLDHYAICCTTCCCPIIVPAQTYHYADVGSFTKWLIILGIVYAIPGLIGFTCIFPLILCYKRRQIRGQSQPPMRKDSCMDLVKACCCPLCVICQEARHLEEALRAKFGDEADLWKQELAANKAGLKELEKLNDIGQKVVGAPVKVQPEAEKKE